MSETNDERRPLLLVPGYSISRHGQVFNARTGNKVKSFSLTQARQFATADISHNPTSFDPKERKLLRVPHDPLVFEGVCEVEGGDSYAERRVAWVRLPTALESNRDLCVDKGPDGQPALRRTYPDGRIEWINLKDDDCERDEGLRAYVSGSSFCAVGNTSRGWFRLEHDTSKILFHGESYAATIFQQK